MDAKRSQSREGCATSTSNVWGGQDWASERSRATTDLPSAGASQDDRPPGQALESATGAGIVGAVRCRRPRSHRGSDRSGHPSWMAAARRQQPDVHPFGRRLQFEAGRSVSRPVALTWEPRRQRALGPSRTLLNVFVQGFLVLDQRWASQSRALPLPPNRGRSTHRRHLRRTPQWTRRRTASGAEASVGARLAAVDV